MSNTAANNTGSFVDLLEIQTADTLDTFRTEFNKVANLINLSYSSESSNTELYPDWDPSTIVMRGPNGEFSAGDLVVNNIFLQGEISGKINMISDDDFSTKIKLDGEDELIDDETIKFYAGGGTTGSERATINSSMIHLRLDTNQMGVFNAYSQVNIMDQLVVYQNTEFKNPVMLSTGNNTITVGLEGQVRYNIESEEVQAYKLNDGWTNVASSIDAATDTILTNPADNEVLTWNGSSWVNLPVNPLGSASMDILADVAIDAANVVSGMFIRHDGTYWREETLSLDMASDFDSVNRTPNDGDVLHWDTANSTWVPNTVANTSTANATLVAHDIIFTRQDTTLYSVNVESLFDSVNAMSDVDTTGAYQDAILKWDIGPGGVGRWIVTAQDSVANTSIKDAHLGSQTSVYANTILVERANGLDPFNIPLHDLISSIDRLGDVSTKDGQAPSAGQALVWDDVASRWSPNNIVATTANLTANFLNELSDVTSATPLDGQILKYSTTTSKWEIGNDINDITQKALTELQDVDIVSPTANSYLKWTGAEWVAASDIVSESLGKLTDVAIDDPLYAPQHMQVLKFNTNTNKWEPHDDSLTEIGSFGLSRLSDVDVETLAPTDGQVLKWDQAALQWKPVADDSYLAILDTVVLTIMNDVDLVTTPPATGDILKYDGTMWVAHTPADIATIDDIGDVDISTIAPQTGQVLKWDGTNFTPANDAIADFASLSFSVFQDVDVASATVGNHLVFNGVDWVPEDASIPRDLNDLLNVNHTTTNALQSGHLLSWDGTQWVSRAETPVDLSTHSINELTDVVTDNVILATGMYLRWDGGTGWKASPADTVSLDMLDLFANTQALDEQILIFNGTANNYEPANIPNQSIEVMTDTDLTSLQDDDVLRYNQSTSMWEPEAPFDESYLSLTDLPTISQVGNTGEYSDLLNKPDLKPIATSGSYTALTDLPTLHAIAGTGSFDDMVDKPTTLAGYGITDAMSGSATTSFNDLTDKPTNLAGYGINDAFDGDYDSLTNLPDLTGLLAQKMNTWVSEPTTSFGQAGDTAGMLAYTDSFMYICVRDFDGADGCWKRITLSSATW